MTVKAESNMSIFLLGLGIGASVAILFAPKAGDETQMYLKDKMKEARQYAQGKVHEMQIHAKDFLDCGEQAFAREVERISSAVDAGREAYRRSKASGFAA